MRIATLALPLLLLAAPAVAADDTPVALVLEVQGRVVPEVAPYSELNEGDRIDVPGGSRLVVLHYLSCDEMSVSQGSLEVHLLQYDWRGAPAQIARRPCPSTVAVGDASPGGIVFRGSGGPAAPVPTSVVAPRPVFVLIGGGSATATAITLKQGDQVLATLPVRSGRAVWPSDKPALAAGAYKGEIAGAAGETAFEVNVAGPEESRVLMVNVGR